MVGHPGVGRLLCSPHLLDQRVSPAFPESEPGRVVSREEGGSALPGCERRNDIIKVGKRGSEPHYCSGGAGGGRTPSRELAAPTASSQNSAGDAAVKPRHCPTDRPTDHRPPA